MNQPGGRYETQITFVLQVPYSFFLTHWKRRVDAEHCTELQHLHEQVRIVKRRNRALAVRPSWTFGTTKRRSQSVFWHSLHETTEWLKCLWKQNTLWLSLQAAPNCTGNLKILHENKSTNVGSSCGDPFSVGVAKLHTCEQDYLPVQTRTSLGERSAHGGHSPSGSKGRGVICTSRTFRLDN